MANHACANRHCDRPQRMSLLFGTMLVLCLPLGSLHGLIEFNDVMQNQARHPFSWLNATFNATVAIFMPISTYKAPPYPPPTKRWEKIVLKVLCSRAIMLYFAGSGMCYCAQAILHIPIRVLDEKGLSTVGMVIALFILRRRQCHRTYDEITLTSGPVTSP